MNLTTIQKKTIYYIIIMDFDLSDFGGKKFWTLENRSKKKKRQPTKKML